jgi:hypothetical protein
MAGLGFLEHHIRGLDDGADCIADFQLHFVGTAAADDAFDDVVADVNDDVGHHITKSDLGDLTNQTIAG